MREIKYRFYYRGIRSAWHLLEELTLVEITDKCEFHWDLERVEVCQYTGLKDKNGKEIYEGDIVDISKVGITDMSDPDPNRRIIKWEDEEGGFKQFRLDGMAGGSGWCFTARALKKYYEVIGNIYENPELTNPGGLYGKDKGN